MGLKDFFNFGQNDIDEGFEDYGEDAGYDDSSSAVTNEEADYSSMAGSRMNVQKPRVFNMNSTGSKLAILVPESYDEVIRDAVADLKDNAIVVINLEKISAADRQRIVDFITGVVAAIDGKINKIGSGLYAAAPKNVDWIHDIDEYGI